MSEWKEYRFTEAATLTNGRAYLQPELQDAGKYRIVRVGNLSGGDKWFYSDLELSEDKYCHKGDLLNAWACSFGPYIWNEDKTIYHYHIWKVDVNKALTDKMFLYYYLKYYTPKWMGLTNGSVMMHITKGSLEKQLIRLPDLETQRHIASILFSLDDKIAVNRKICRNLEAQAQALFKHWFVDFAPFKNGRFVESELGLIPEGWRVGRLEELCSFISRGLSPKYQLGTNELVLGQTCVRNNIVTLNNAREHLPKTNCNRYVRKWDILLNSTGIGSLGRVGIIYFDDKNVCFDSHLTVVRVENDIYRYYVGRNLLSRQNEIENMAVGSTGQTELPKKDVLVMPILIPNSDVLPEFNEIIKNIGNTLYKLIEENRRLATLRDTLLPKLMSGQIKVNDVKI